MDTCCILLSSYNGETFLYEQLNSLRLQKTSAEIIIKIRDDGSSDGTQTVVEKFIQEYPETKIIFENGQNIGVQRSFLDLMYNAPDADYYAFCDQDDVWKPGKIQAAINALNKFKHIPATYYSNFDIVDSELKLIVTSEIAQRGVTDSVTQILFQNRVPGCTMVFNRNLIKIVQSIHIDMVCMHDAYVLAIAYICGKVIGDTTSQIMYRQHGSNVLGYKKKFPGMKKWIKEKMELLKDGEPFSMAHIAKKILEMCCNKCDEDVQTELEVISTYDKKIIPWFKLLISSQTASKINFRATLSIKSKILFRII